MRVIILTLCIDFKLTLNGNSDVLILCLPCLCRSVYAFVDYSMDLILITLVSPWFLLVFCFAVLFFVTRVLFIRVSVFMFFSFSSCFLLHLNTVK